MRKSIRFKLTLMLVALMAALILSIWLISNYMMKGFFALELKNSMGHTFDEVNALFSEASDEETIKESFSQIAIRSDTTVLVLAMDGSNTIYSNISEKGRMRESLMTILSLFQEPESSEIPPEDWQLTREAEINLSKSNYIIQQNHDTQLQSDYYDLVGRLNNGDLVAIRSSVKRVDDSAKIASRLIGYVGIVITIIGSVIMFIVSNSFARPIKNMASVAKKMTNMDFNAKVTRLPNDEIGELGESINELSKKLQLTISELKSANNELRKDIEHKTHIEEMRTEFLSHVSHELKTPIALIQGYAEGLSENISDDAESRAFYCEVITDEANKMNAMVKKLLTLNEIECGTDNVNIIRFDIVELISNIIHSFDIIITQENIEVEFDPSEHIYTWADEFMIEGVISNYISNALHYTGENGYIGISLEQVGSELQISVYNRGVNIPEDELDKIWGKFYKIDKARTREYGGNGIGLSIVAASMEAHGKRYGAYNVEDGVVFYIYLDTDTSC